MHIFTQRLFGEGCDKVQSSDEHILLLGMMGLLAVQIPASGVVVNVPTDVPHKLARQTKCLDNQRWWGMPKL